MNPRWAARIIGIAVILAMLMMLAHLQRRLAELQRQRPVPARSP